MLTVSLSAFEYVRPGKRANNSQERSTSQRHSCKDTRVVGILRWKVRQERLAGIKKAQQGSAKVACNSCSCMLGVPGGMPEPGLLVAV